MGLKQLLGLDTFPLHDREIMKQIQDAYRKQQVEVVFSSGKKRVVVRLRQCATDGLMNDWHDYYGGR